MDAMPGTVKKEPAVKQEPGASKPKSKSKPKASGRSGKSGRYRKGSRPNTWRAITKKINQQPRSQDSEPIDLEGELCWALDDARAWRAIALELAHRISGPQGEMATFLADVRPCEAGIFSPTYLAHSREAKGPVLYGKSLPPERSPEALVACIAQWQKHFPELVATARQREVEFRKKARQSSKPKNLGQKKKTLTLNSHALCDKNKERSGLKAPKRGREVGAKLQTQKLGAKEKNTHSQLSSAL